MENLNPNPLSLNVITARTPAARQAALEASKLVDRALAKLEPYLADEDAPRDTLCDILQRITDVAESVGCPTPPRRIDWAEVTEGAAWFAFGRAHRELLDTTDEVPEPFMAWAAEVVRKARAAGRQPEFDKWFYASQFGHDLAKDALEAEAER